MACLLGHKWNGCKCEKCGKVRNERHHWENGKCTVCGAVQESTAANPSIAGKVVRHIVCICYDSPLSNQWKPQIQQYIIDKEKQAGNIIGQTSRITFESFMDNSHLYNDDSLKMKLKQVYGQTYGFADAEFLTNKSVYKGDMTQNVSDEIMAKFFVLYQ